MRRWLALRSSERVRPSLVPARACVDLDCAVLYVVVLIQLVEVAAGHRALGRLAGVDRVAPTILGPKVTGAEELLLPLSRVRRLIACIWRESNALEELLLTRHLSIAL